MSSVRGALLVATLAWFLVACGGESPERATDTGSTPAPTPTETAVEPTDPSPSPSTPPGGAAAGAVTDLAARLGIEQSAVEVVAVQEVTWRDGSLGCAQKGMMYTQSLIDGQRITLRADGTSYEYHAGGSGSPFLCERPTQ